MKRYLAYLIGSFVFLALPVWVALLLLSARLALPEGLNFTKVGFEALEGWHSGEVLGAVSAFEKSCVKLRSLPKDRALPGARIGGRVGDWLSVCEKIPDTDTLTEAAARAYFEANFQPFAVSAGDNYDGKFTGYYEPLLKGSFDKSDIYKTPILSRPDDLVMVDLGQFRGDLRGRRIAGSVRGGRLVPYEDRKNIGKGALEERVKPLLYVDSAEDAYFLHIQGSGRVLMPDDSLIMVGYAAQNGHISTLAGSVLIKEGEIAREDMSMQAIRAWFKENPERVEDIMNRNRSYVFFRFLEGTEGPFGSANVALTPRHSLAVDRKHLSLHMPMWLSASYPDPEDREGEPLPLNRLMIAQDTGGAIKGEIRGDVFWGFGDEAEEIAGRMANGGRYWVLLPKALASKNTASKKMSSTKMASR